MPRVGAKHVSFTGWKSDSVYLVLCIVVDGWRIDGRFSVHSTNTCRLSCRSRLAVQLCGCKPFYYFYEEGTQCGPAGMACLSGYSQRLANLLGVECVCSQQCVDAVFREVSTVDQFWDRGPFQSRGAVRFTVQAPRTRYTREIVFQFEDLVVSFGGAAGLFLGASFISFIEVVYFLLDRLVEPLMSSAQKGQVTMMKESRKARHTLRIEELNMILEEENEKKYSISNKYIPQRIQFKN